MFDTLVAEGLLLVAIISGIPLLVSCVVSLVLSVFQAATQIQEQTVQFLVRVVTVSAVLIVGADFFSEKLVRFMQDMLSSLVYFGQMS